MAKFHQTCLAIEKVLIFVVALFAAIMIIVTSVEVFRRYVFSLSFQWSEELARYLMVSVAFYGGAVAYRRKNLIPLDLFTNFMPPRIQLYLETLLEIISFFILIVLMYFSTKSVMNPAVYRQISVGFPISMGIVFLAMPISFACMILFALEHFVELFGKIKEGVS
ncbi:MAG: TRAP transporter small permease [Clostridia bacterium]|jgi:C4-dicarboxylate transporter DctQ subunit|nr:TRAP transporter small permease [Clostridia bacterium]